MFTEFNILRAHGHQSIPDLRTVELPAIFRGRMNLHAAGLDVGLYEQTVGLCPTGALAIRNGMTLDMGRCLFCGECARRHPRNIVFTNDHRMATYSREDLLVRADIPFIANSRPTRLPLFSKSLKLRQVCAGGDGACEMELNAAGNVNFDFGRFGVEFVASPRHADALVLTGPITRAMSRETEIAFEAMPHPKMIILVGTDAISGGLYAESAAVDRSFLERHDVSLYVPGHPAHPLTFIDGIMRLIGCNNK